MEVRYLDYNLDKTFPLGDQVGFDSLPRPLTMYVSPWLLSHDPSQLGHGRDIQAPFRRTPLQRLQILKYFTKSFVWWEGDAKRLLYDGGDLVVLSVL